MTTPPTTAPSTPIRKEDATTTAASTPQPGLPGKFRLGHAGLGLTLAAVIIFTGNYHISTGESGGTGPAVGTAIIVVVLTALCFGLLLPRLRPTGRASLILAILSVLSVVVFWSGITPILAATTLEVSSHSATSNKQLTTARALAITAALIATTASAIQLL